MPAPPSPNIASNWSPEYRVLDRGSAMLGSNRQPDRREWTRTAIGANAGVNRNTHVASCWDLNLTFDRIVVLRIELLLAWARTSVAIAQRAEADNSTVAKILVVSFRVPCVKVVPKFGSDEAAER
jgi:hypothetical protein